MNAVMPNPDFLFSAILSASLMATVLAVAVWIVCRLFQKQIGPTACLCLFLLVMIRLIPIEGPASPFSLWNLLPWHSSSSSNTISQITVSYLPATGDEHEPDAMLAFAPPAETSSVTTDRSRFDWIAVLWRAAIFAWLLGVAIQLTRILLESGKIRRLIRGATPAQPETWRLMHQVQSQLKIRTTIRLLESNEIESPLISGCFKPVILIPGRCSEELDTEQMRWVLAHELLHHRRRDLMVLFVCLALRSVHWFNPIAWMTVARIRDLQEIACDAQVLEAFCNETPAIHKQYGQVILTIAQWYNYSGKNDFQLSGSAPGIAFLDDHSRLTERILMLTQKPVFSRVRVIVTAVLVIAISGAGFTAAQDKVPVVPPLANKTTSESTDHFELLTVTPKEKKTGQNVNVEQYSSLLNPDLSASDNQPNLFAAKLLVVQGSFSDIRKLLSQSESAELYELVSANQTFGSAEIEAAIAGSLLEQVGECGCEICCQPTVVAMKGLKGELLCKMDYPLKDWVESSGEWELAKEEPEARQELEIVVKPVAKKDLNPVEMTWEITIQVGQLLGNMTNQIVNKTDKTKSFSIPGFSVRRFSTSFSLDSDHCQVYLVPTAYVHNQLANGQQQAWRVLPDGTPCPVPPIQGQPVNLVESDPRDSIFFGATLFIIQTGMAEKTPDE